MSDAEHDCSKLILAGVCIHKATPSFSGNLDHQSSKEPVLTGINCHELVCTGLSHFEVNHVELEDTYLCI